jgi:hypothetical protein
MIFKFDMGVLWEVGYFGLEVLMSIRDYLLFTTAIEFYGFYLSSKKGC